MLALALPSSPSNASVAGLGMPRALRRKYADAMESARLPEADDWGGGATDLLPLSPPSPSPPSSSTPPTPAQLLPCAAPLRPPARKKHHAHRAQYEAIHADPDAFNVWIPRENRDCVRSMIRDICADRKAVLTKENVGAYVFLGTLQHGGQAIVDVRNLPANPGLLVALWYAARTVPVPLALFVPPSTRFHTYSTMIHWHVVRELVAMRWIDPRADTFAVDTLVPPHERSFTFADLTGGEPFVTVAAAADSLRGATYSPCVPSPSPPPPVGAKGGAERVVLSSASSADVTVRPRCTPERDSKATQTDVSSLSLLRVAVSNADVCPTILRNSRIRRLARLDETRRATDLLGVFSGQDSVSAATDARAHLVRHAYAYLSSATSLVTGSPFAADALAPEDPLLGAAACVPDSPSIGAANRRVYEPVAHCDANGFAVGAPSLDTGGSNWSDRFDIAHLPLHPAFELPEDY
jgi:hypothetical protein